MSYIGNTKSSVYCPRVVDDEESLTGVIKYHRRQNTFIIWPLNHNMYVCYPYDLETLIYSCYVDISSVLFTVSFRTKGGVAVRRWTCIMGSIPTGRKLRNNPGQVVHTYVSLSPSSITWYWSNDDDVL